MLDLKFVRENPEVVKQNIRNKFQDAKLPMVDEVIELDAKNRAAKAEADSLRASRNKLSKQIGQLMGQGKKDEAEEVKAQVAANAARLAELEAQETELEAKVLKIMMTIPNIIDPSVPIGKDDSQNVEIEKFGDPFVPDFEIPYHTDIMKTFDGIDLDAAGKVAGNGFYYLMGDIARLHSAVISYARDFMINRGFTYCIPPFMIRSNVVTGVMSFASPRKILKDCRFSLISGHAGDVDAVYRNLFFQFCLRNRDFRFLFCIRFSGTGCFLYKKCNAENCQDQDHAANREFYKIRTAASSSMPAGRRRPCFIIIISGA